MGKNRIQYFQVEKCWIYQVQSVTTLSPQWGSKWTIFPGCIEYFCGNGSALFWLNIRKRDPGIPFLKSAQLDHNQHSSANIMAAHSHPVQKGDAGITNHLPFQGVSRMISRNTVSQTRLQEEDDWRKGGWAILYTYIHFHFHIYIYP